MIAHVSNCLRASRRLGPALFCFSLLCSVCGEARITRIEISATEAPTLNGQTFGSAGQYQKLTGTVYGTIDPKDPRNAIITDIGLAPTNAQGLVEYSSSFLLFRPMDLSKGNGMIWYNVNNRGGAATSGDSALMSLGYTYVQSGWQPDLLPQPNVLTMNVPVAKGAGGASITGMVRSEYIVAAQANFLNLASGRFTSPPTVASTTKSYETVSLDNNTPLADGFVPTLTVRSFETDPRVSIPSTQWAFGSCADGVQVTPSSTQICLLGGGFQPRKIYELVYRAKDPLILGLGFAGMRDLVSFLKHDAKDDGGTPNPAFTDGNALAIFSGVSQSGRAIRSFIHMGFNEDEKGRIAFDGALPVVGGGRVALNVRFGYPSRGWGDTADHVYEAYEFPFGYSRSFDPLTGATAGILDRCLQSNTCPKIFHFATSLEIWEGRQSLGLTDTLGQADLPIPQNVRIYIQGSTQHGPRAPNPITASGSQGSSELCAQQQNPNSYGETVRALYVALQEWVKNGTEPPPSAVPTIASGTLVLPSSVRFPSIPATNYGGVARPAVGFVGKISTLRPLSWGSGFNNVDESGIASTEPPLVPIPTQYGVRVFQVDQDGNDIGGIRSIAVQVPIATYTGWNMSRDFPGFLCSLTGSYIPFATTKAQRVAAGDPRLSLEERYGTFSGYYWATVAAIQQAVANRFLLPSDANALLTQRLQDVLSAKLFSLTKADLSLLKKVAPELQLEKGQRGDADTPIDASPDALVEQ